MVWASCQIRKIAGAHAPGMPGTFSPSPQVSDPDMHHGTCVTHVPWCMPGSPTSGFIWNRRRGETIPAFPARMRNLQFYVSGKRPMMWWERWLSTSWIFHLLWVWGNRSFHNEWMLFVNMRWGGMFFLFEKYIPYKFEFPADWQNRYYIDRKLLFFIICSNMLQRYLSCP